MNGELAINARFLAQPTTGVQRFAREMTLALGKLRGKPLLLGPAGATLPDDWRAAGWRLATHPSATGQRWEQFLLPRATGAAMLVNLANTAPLLRRRQLLVLHDAGVFATPEAYSRPFRTWYRLLHRALAWRGTALATVSEFSRGEIERRLGVPRERVVVLGEGAEHILREPAVPPPLAAGSYVLAVGTPAAHKNLEDGLQRGKCGASIGFGNVQSTAVRVDTGIDYSDTGAVPVDQSGKYPQLRH